MHWKTGKFLSFLTCLSMIIMINSPIKLVDLEWSNKLMRLIIFFVTSFLLAYLWIFWSCRSWKRLEDKQMSLSTQSSSVSENIVIKRPITQMSSNQLSIETEQNMYAYNHRLEPQEGELIKDSKIIGFYVYPKKDVNRIVEFVPRSRHISATFDQNFDS